MDQRTKRIIEKIFICQNKENIYENPKKNQENFKNKVYFFKL